MVVTQVALPELDGAMEPIVFAGRDPTTGKSHSLPDRVESLVTRANKWAMLRKKKVAEKKVAITVFSFPPDKGNVGTAAYLNVFGSIHKVLKDMKRQGYDVRRCLLCAAIALMLLCCSCAWCCIVLQRRGGLRSVVCCSACTRALAARAAHVTHGLCRALCKCKCSASDR